MKKTKSAKKSKLFLSLIGMLSGLLLIIFGFIAVLGGLGDGHYSGSSSSSYLYDYGYAQFGSDYYSYSVNNSARAAEGATSASSNLREISDILKNTIGISMMCFGLFGISGFGIIFSDCINKSKVLPEATATPTYYNAQGAPYEYTPRPNTPPVPTAPEQVPTPNN